MQRLEKLQIPFNLIIIDEAHHLRNEGTRSNQLGKLLSLSSEGMVFLSATPLQLGNRDLYNLLNILLPEEYQNYDVFEEQLKPNEFINLALQKLARKESYSSVINELKRVENTSQCERFLANPNYQLCLNILKSTADTDNQALILLQRKLYELNVLSQIYTRTKKKKLIRNRRSERQGQ